MSEPFQTIFAVLGTVFDMFTTMLFYKTCFGRKNIRVKKFTFYLVYTLFYAFGLVLSQFGYMPAFYLIKSFVIMFGLTLLYDAKWTTRLFAALSYLTFGIIADIDNMVVDMYIGVSDNIL